MGLPRRGVLSPGGQPALRDLEGGRGILMHHVMERGHDSRGDGGRACVWQKDKRAQKGVEGRARVLGSLG